MASKALMPIRIMHLILAAALAGPGATFAQGIAAEWHGAIEVEDDAPLRLALHIVQTRSGGITATVDSMDEGVMDLAADALAIRDSTVKFEIRSIGGTYEGTIAPDGSRIAGSWSQDHRNWPLVWIKGEDPGNTVKLLDEHQALANGRTCTQWFYENKISDLWKKLSPVAQQALGSESELHILRQQALQQTGGEIKISEESLKTEGILQVYRRLAKFDRGGTEIEVTMGFDPAGLVAEFRIRPVSVP